MYIVSKIIHGGGYIYMPQTSIHVSIGNKEMSLDTYCRPCHRRWAPLLARPTPAPRPNINFFKRIVV